MRQVININSKWAFSKETDRVPESMPNRWVWVNLPHTWNNIDGQDGDNDYYRGTAFYAKQIRKTDLPDAEKYYLEFCGANASADVYVNGKKLAHHDGGYSSWRVEITGELKEENLIVAAVDNSVNNTVYPQHADFTFYGGLYRDVNIIAVNDSHFDLDYYGSKGIMVTPKVEGKDAKVNVEVFVTNKKNGQQLVYKILDADKNVVAEKTTEDEQISFDIKNANLWDGRKNPYLYTAIACLYEGKQLLDSVCTRFGCRSYKIDPQKGFILNGREYPLRGVSRHQDWWGLGNALQKKHHKKDMDLIAEMGANTIRLAHYQHDQYFYDLCDEYGMVVWAEIPYISNHMPTGRENTISQMRELIVQNYNHPSIVVWGLSNEITMSGKSDEDLIENHKILNNLAHDLDNTRPTCIACITACSMDDPYIQIPDVVSYNHYFGWYGGDTSMNGPWFDAFHEKFPNIPIGCSEYGCEALNWHTSNPEQGDYTEEYQAYYHEELIKQLFSRKFIWATHVWNMFDFGADARNEGGENGQNHKGLVTFDRKYKKDSFYAYKAWLSDEPFVHICGKRYIDRVEPYTKVTVYSNLDEVELFANGSSLGKQKSKEHFFYFNVPNSGCTRLVAKAGDCIDESYIRKVDKFNDAYRLVEKGAVLNWFDITEKDGYFSLNDKVKDIISTSEGKAYFENLIADLSKDGDSNGMFAVSAEMMQMLGSFTVLRLLNLMAVAGIKPDRERLLKINAELNNISKTVS